MAAVRHIFRWDLDKTYLKTDFDTVRDLVRTARATAEQRENIPGSAALIRGIRDEAPRGQQHLIYFVSGSPEQMRSVLERKFLLDGFEPDGFVLKPTLSDIFRGRFRSVRSQIAYKLSALLRGRSEAPIGARETLVGDDAESDAFIYTLYADLVAGRLPIEQLRKLLKNAGAYRDQIRLIEAELEAVVHEDAVERVIIHLDQRTPPAAFYDFFPLVVPIYNHLQTAVVLYLDGRISVSTIARVTGELLERFGFDELALTNSAEDILRRRRVHYPMDMLERLADELARYRVPVETGTADADRSALAVQAVLARVAHKVDLLRGRPPPRHAEVAPGKRNYVKLFEKEEARREEVRRAKKLYAKTSRRPAEQAKES